MYFSFHKCFLCFTKQHCQLSEYCSLAIDNIVFLQICTKLFHLDICLKKYLILNKVSHVMVGGHAP